MKKILSIFPATSLIVAVAVFIFFSTLRLSSFGEWVENSFEPRLSHSARKVLNREPYLDSRIKIIALDRRTLIHLEREDLNIDEWGKLLYDISLTEPKAIVIDKTFATPRDIKSAEKVTSFQKFLSQKKAPIFVGASTEQNWVGDNSSLNISSDLPQLSKLTSRNSLDLQFSWLPIETSFIFGPHAAIRQGFSGIGHLQIEQDGRIQPFIRMAYDRIFPQVSLLLADKLQIEKNALFINGKKTPFDSEGRITPNLASRDLYLKHTKRFLYYYSKSQRSEPIENIDKGDIVLLLPLMFPGHTDWKDSPQGRIEGGFIIAAMINSVLTGQWLSYFENETTLLFFACLLGLALARFHKSTGFAISLVSITLFMALGSIALFTYFGIIITWAIPASAFASASTLVFALKTRQIEMRLQSLRSILKNRIPADRLERLIKHPELLVTEPTGKVVTVMFIDIVGFSKLAEISTPQENFAQLKSVFDMLRKIVHSYNGVVDKTLGDGMMCYFGYHYDGETLEREHADIAVACAIEIQKSILAYNLKAQSEQKIIYPLRIGINTCAVLLGNIGQADEFDFTLVGDGVNVAKRLESACSHYSIVIGATTFDTLLNSQLLAAKMTRKLVPIKHSSAPLLAYECVPNFEKPEELLIVTEAYRKLVGLERLEQRWPVPADAPVQISTNFGRAQILNFSQYGFAITLPKYLAHGNSLTLNLSDISHDHPTLPTTLIAEIRWSMQDQTGRFIHGVLIKNINEGQSTALLEIFRNKIQLRQKAS